MKIQFWTVATAFVCLTLGVKKMLVTRHKQMKLLFPIFILLCNFLKIPNHMYFTGSEFATWILVEKLHCIITCC